MPGVLEAADISRVNTRLQVRDELVFETPAADAEAAMAVIRSVMETADEPAVKLSVPLVVDAKGGGELG